MVNDRFKLLAVSRKFHHAGRVLEVVESHCMVMVVCKVGALLTGIAVHARRETGCDGSVGCFVYHFLYLFASSVGTKKVVVVVVLVQGYLYRVN